MNGFAVLLLMTGFVPMAQALRANRWTTIRQPLLWAMLAWAAWNWVGWSRMFVSNREQQVGAFVALCLTGCAGIAVLGARRPGVTAWNFVVLGLLAVLLLPVVNRLGAVKLEPAQELFLALTLIVPVLNYLPTRLGPGILFAAAGCALELIQILHTTPSPSSWLAGTLLGLGPWIAWGGLMRPGSAVSEFDRLWLAYRDRFGFAWGQRMREQFNRAAHHAGWPVVLRWQGLHPSTGQPIPTDGELLSLLRAVLKRFGPETETPSSL